MGSSLVSSPDFDRTGEVDERVFNSVVVSDDIPHSFQRWRTIREREERREGGRGRDMKRTI